MIKEIIKKSIRNGKFIQNPIIFRLKLRPGSSIIEHTFGTGVLAKWICYSNAPGSAGIGAGFDSHGAASSGA